MDYSSSLAYLYGLQHFGVKLGLENTRQLLERIDNPQQRLRVVHIAGTNGKGSTAAALEAILRRAGQRTGLYTSPHLHSFTERIRIDNQPVSEADVVHCTEAIRRRMGDLTPTFFEFTTAMALGIFAARAVDWTILETGLGGRLDSTNVVTPRLSIITPIAIDHAEHLGNSLAAIAAEKGGIIKPGVPVICARQQPEALETLQRLATERQAPFYLAGRDFDWQLPPRNFSYCGLRLQLEDIESGLPGVYQRENLSLALVATELLFAPPPDSVRLRRALAAVRWPGRLEWCGEVLLDGAHNPHAAEALASYLAEQDLDDLLWVVALKADKDSAGILQPLLPRAQKLFIARLETEASVPPARLLELAESHGVDGEVCGSAADALQRALAVRRPGQKVLVAGSLFLVAALREQCLQRREETGA